MLNHQASIEQIESGARPLIPNCSPIFLRYGKRAITRVGRKNTQRAIIEAGEENRTRDFRLGKVVISLLKADKYPRLRKADRVL